MTKVILKSDMEALGASGDVVDVKPGYARNYLIPHGLAYEASAANMQRVEEERALAQEHAKRDYLEARRRASQIEGVSLTFRARAGEGEGGKLFGSVTSGDVADRMNGLDLDFEVERRQVDMEEPLKQLGTFLVPVRLHHEVEVEVEICIERED